MDLQSDSEDEVEVERQDEDEEQASARAHPTYEEEVASSARKCGTPGCDLADGHLELCKTQQVTGPRQRGPLVSVQTGQAKKAETKKVPPLITPLTAAEARAQATSEGLTLQPSANSAGYPGVSSSRDSRLRERPFRAKLVVRGKQVDLGYFTTAEEAALAYQRAKSHNTVSQFPRARANASTTKRAAPPPKPPRTKQARQATATRPSQAVPPPVYGIAAAAAPTPAAPPAETLLQKVDRIRVVLELDTALSLVNTIKAANELMEISPAAGAGLPSQVNTLLATLF